MEPTMSRELKYTKMSQVLYISGQVIWSAEFCERYKYEEAQIHKLRVLHGITGYKICFYDEISVYTNNTTGKEPKSTPEKSNTDFSNTMHKSGKLHPHNILQQSKFISIDIIMNTIEGQLHIDLSPREYQNFLFHKAWGPLRREKQNFFSYIFVSNWYNE